MIQCVDKNKIDITEKLSEDKERRQYNEMIVSGLFKKRRSNTVKYIIARK